MSALEAIFLLLLQASIGSSALIALVLLLRRWREGRLLPRVMPLLWLLVLVKLLVPALPETPFNLFRVVPALVQEASSAVSEAPAESAASGPASLPAAAQPADPGAEASAISTADSDKPTAAAAPDPAASALSLWLTLGALVWLAGMLALGGTGLYAALRFRRILTHAVPVQAASVLFALEACRQRLDIRRRIGLYELPGRAGPFVYGWMRPAVYMPAGFAAEADSRQLTHVLLHELIHVKRKDVWVGALWAAVAAIYWFNPFVWLALRSMKADREIACDAGVLDALGEREGSSYGMTLLQLARRPGPRPAPGLPFALFPQKRGELKRRIAMIARFREGSYRLSFPIIVLALAASAVLLMMASAPLQGPKTLETVSAKGDSRGPGSLGITRNMDDFKWFSSLDRLRVHTNFDFKVPDDLPQGYKMSYLNVDQAVRKEEKDRVTVGFVSMSPAAGYVPRFELKASLNDLRETYRVQPGEEFWTNAPAMRGKPEPIAFRHEPAEFAGIQGTLVTEVQNYAWHLPEHAKTFIWKDGDVWYALDYFSENHSQKEGTPQHWMNLSDAQRDQVLRSFVWPDQVKATDYSGAGEPFPLYDTEDLDAATKILGFEPMLPKTIMTEKLTLDNAVMLQRGGRNISYPSLIVSDSLESTYRAPSNAPIGDRNDTVSFYQGSGPLVEADKLIPPSRISLHGMDLLVVKDSNSATNPYGFDKGYNDDRTHTYYIWESGGRHYVAFFRGMDEFHHEVLKELVGLTKR